MKYIRNKLLKAGLAFCLLTIFNGTSCRKEKETVCSDENTIFYPKDAFDRFYFKDSTYWIYKDSVTGQLDSAWVDHSISGKGSNISNGFKGKCYQYGNYYVESKYMIKYNFLMRTGGQNNGYTYFKIIVQPDQKGLDINFALIKESNYISEGLGDGMIDSLNSIIVNGVVYNDVLQWKSTLSAQYPYFFLTAYYVKNIGLIKYKAPNGSVWELIKYKIKQ